MIFGTASTLSKLNSLVKRMMRNVRFSEATPWKVEAYPAAPHLTSPRCTSFAGRGAAGVVRNDEPR
jgi:hypothetical protein